MNVTTYGPGGYDPTKADNNVVESRDEADIPEVVNADVIQSRLDAALGALRAFIDAPKPTTAAAQASAAYDAAKLCCRVLVGLIRLHLRRLDATD